MVVPEVLPLRTAVNTFVAMSSPAVAAPRAQADAAAAPPQRSVTLAWLAAIPIALHAVLAWMLRAPTLATGNDDAVYLLLARALRAGHYRELFYIGTPIHSQYPPGYPALLALLGAPADGEVTLIIAVNILLSCAALWLAFDVMRHWSLPLGLAGVAVLAVNPSLIEAASHVQSEPMFMAAVTLALWALRPSAPEKHRWIAIAAAIVAALTRSAGVAIIAGLFAHFVLSRSWRHAGGLALAALLTIVPWMTWTVLAPQKVIGRSYIADALVTIPAVDPSATQGAGRSRELQRRPPTIALVRSMALRVRTNVPRYFTRALPTELSVPTIEGTRIDNAGWLLVMLVALFAGCVAAWTRWRAAVLVLLAYGALLVLWPYVINRFLSPLLPVFVALLLLGAWRIGVRVLPRAALVPALALAAIPLAGGTHAVGATIAGRGDCPPDEREVDGSCGGEAPRYRRTVDSLATRLPAGARVFTSKEGTFFYRTGIPVVPIYGIVRMPAPELEAYLRETETTLIFLPHLKPEEQFLIEALAELCPRLTDVGSPADELLMLWNRPPGAGETDGCDAVARWSVTW